MNVATPVRVRFAPSPTGLLHIGGARTALFGWLFARHCGGSFILRIEDTDRARFNSDALTDLFESLRWLGLTWDEGPEVGGAFGPYVQSERIELYRIHAAMLLESGHAYKCFCTPERLEAMRQEQERRGAPPGYDRACRELSAAACARHEAAGAPCVVRFKMPRDGATVFTDIIRGKISYPNTQQDDFVLLKSDGFPTYHLANVVDDHAMRITHVTRGEEWIPSTPKHIQLYAAFGWTPPHFAHFPVILAPGGGKLSKRHGAAAVSEYRAMGYLPEALLNFLALLGWAISGDKEVLPLSEMIGHFTLEAINKTGAQFNREKLDWMNGVYLRQLPLERLTELVRPWLEREGLLASDTPADRLACAMRLAQERMQLLPDAIEHSYCFLAEEPRYDEHAVRKFLGKAGVREHLAAVGALLAAVPDGDFLPPRLAEVLMGYLATSGQSLKTVVHPLRVAVTGRAASPGIFETLSCIGKTRVLRRITHAVETLCHAH